MHKIKPRWLAIEGIVDIGESVISYVGEKKSIPKKGEASKDEGAPPSKVQSARIRSDVYFESGDITGEIRISRAELRLFFRLGANTSNARTTVGLGVSGKVYGLAALENNENREIDFSGSGTTTAGRSVVSISNTRERLATGVSN